MSWIEKALEQSLEEQITLESIRSEISNTRDLDKLQKLAMGYAELYLTEARKFKAAMRQITNLEFNGGQPQPLFDVNALAREFMQDLEEELNCPPNATE